jgi:hypothetical protein
MARKAFGLAAPNVRSLILSLNCGAPLAAFAAHTLKLAMPQSGLIVGIGLNVGSRGGTHVTSTVDVKSGANSLLAAPFDVAALTPGTPVQKETDAAFSATGLAVVAKDAVLSVVLNEASGTNPTWADATVQIDYVPVGD